MRKKRIVVDLPVRGLNNQFSLAAQPPLTTPASMNCWAIDSATGRARLGIRPSKIQLGTTGAGAVYHAIPITYTATGTTTVGIAVCGANGTFTSPDAKTYTEHISTNVGSLTWPDQASCAIYQGYLYQASAGSSTVRRRDFVGGSDEALTASAGSVPTNCGIIFRHDNRLVATGDKNNPHVWYACKQKDPTDWDYTNVTLAGAVVSTGADAGEIGEPIVAGISQSSNCALLGSLTSVYSLHGNLRGSGARKISPQVGPLGNNAWCNDAQGNTWMMTVRGLYRIPAGGTYVEPMGEGIPNDLIGLSPANGDAVALGYDHRWPGIHIFVDRTAGDKSYFYSLQTGGIFEQSFSTMPRCAVSFPKIQTDNNSSIVMIDSTAAHQFKRDPETGDSAESRNSYVWIPIRLAEPGSEGILHSITASLAKDSADCDWEIYVGNSAEEAFNSSASFSGTQWSYTSSRYLNYWQYPKRKGAFAYLRIADVANNRWLLEEVVAEITAAGPWRT